MPDITYDDRAVLIDETLVLADIHLGYTDWEGADFPTGEYEQILERLDNLLLKHMPTTVVLAGDIFHKFNQPPEDALGTFQRIVDLVDDYDADLVVTPGNHDTYKFESDMFFTGRSTEAYTADDGLVVFHGHEEPSETDALLVIGHLHPTVRIQSVKRPAYLYGKSVYGDSDVLILPPFSTMPPGTPVRAGDSPAIPSPVVEDGDPLGEYEVIVWDEDGQEALEFPALKQLDKYLDT